jgi:cell division protein FtsB
MTTKKPAAGDVQMFTSIRIVIESVIVLLLGWVGNSVMTLRTDTAVVQTQLVKIDTAVTGITNLKEDQIRIRADVERLQRDVDSLKTKR